MEWKCHCFCCCRRRHRQALERELIELICRILKTDLILKDTDTQPNTLMTYRQNIGNARVVFPESCRCGEECQRSCRDKADLWCRMINEIIVLFTLHYGHLIATLSNIIIKNHLIANAFEFWDQFDLQCAGSSNRHAQTRIRIKKNGAFLVFFFPKKHDVKNIQWMNRTFKCSH